jgi:uncharacterized Zn finger protein (UPF0148 family)
MSVKTFCSICESFIKDVEANELQKLTGKEICAGCGAKVKESQAFLSESIAKYKTEIEKMLSEAKKKFGSLDAAYSRFMSDGTSLYKTTEAELKARLENILK